MPAGLKFGQVKASFFSVWMKLILGLAFESFPPERYFFYFLLWGLFPSALKSLVSRISNGKETALKFLKN